MKLLRRLIATLALLAGTSCGGRSGPAVPAWAKVSRVQVEESVRLDTPVAFENAIGMRFVLIPAGKFVMGSPITEKGRDPGETPHEVSLTQAFYLGVYEVTCEEFHRFRADHFRCTSPDSVGPKPVIGVSYDTASAFAAWLTNLDKDHRYRLPTEAEWEYACRAATRSPFFSGDTATTAQASYNATTSLWGGELMDAGHFAPNAWGLHDMHGNAMEWCADWWAEYPPGRTNDPKGPASSNEHEWRVLRGGAWGLAPDFLRSAWRAGYPSYYDFPDLKNLPTIKHEFLGIRLAATLAP